MRVKFCFLKKLNEKPGTSREYGSTHQATLTKIRYNFLMTLQFEKLSASGFPSPAADFKAPNLDLNKFLIKHKSATFFIRVITDKYRNFFIKKNDVLLVDRATMPKLGQVFITTEDGEFSLQEYKGHNLSHRYMDYWGTVTYVIHSMSQNFKN